MRDRFDVQLFAEVTDIEEAALVMRHKRVAFMKVAVSGEGGSTSDQYVRMQGFTQFSEAKSPKEYARQYVDEATERNNVTGYASNISYSFDRYSEHLVHKKLAQIADNELLGSEAEVEIVVVDIFGDAPHEARKRIYSVSPGNMGDGTDALIYTGVLHAVSGIVLGTATSSDEWKTVTFTE